MGSRVHCGPCRRAGRIHQCDALLLGPPCSHRRRSLACRVSLAHHSRGVRPRGHTRDAHVRRGNTRTTSLSRFQGCCAALSVGWAAGYLSAIPLQLSAFDDALTKAITWPFQRGSPFSAAWSPLAWFGGVSVLLCLWLLFKPRDTGALKETGAISLAAILGSLWWWIEWRPWYFSLLHGAIWGTLVTLGARGLARKPRAAELADGADKAPP